MLPNTVKDWFQDVNIEMSICLITFTDKSDVLEFAKSVFFTSSFSKHGDCKKKKKDWS